MSSFFFPVRVETAYDAVNSLFRGLIRVCLREFTSAFVVAKLPSFVARVSPRHFAANIIFPLCLQQPLFYVVLGLVSISRPGGWISKTIRVVRGEIRVRTLAKATEMRNK